MVWIWNANTSTWQAIEGKAKEPGIQRQAPVSFQKLLTKGLGPAHWTCMNSLNMSYWRAKRKELNSYTFYSWNACQCVYPSLQGQLWGHKECLATKMMLTLQVTRDMCIITEIILVTECSFWFVIKNKLFFSPAFNHSFSQLLKTLNLMTSFHFCYPTSIYRYFQYLSGTK